MAARQALQGVPEVATTSVDMDGAAQLSYATAFSEFSQGLFVFFPRLLSWGFATRLSREDLKQCIVCRLLMMPELAVTDTALHCKLLHVAEVLMMGILIKHRIMICWSQVSWRLWLLPRGHSAPTHCQTRSSLQVGCLAGAAVMQVLNVVHLNRPSRYLLSPEVSSYNHRSLPNQPQVCAKEGMVVHPIPLSSMA